MGKHNLRRIVNLQKWEPMIKSKNIVNGVYVPQSMPSGSLTADAKGEIGRPLKPHKNDQHQRESSASHPALPPCLSPEVLKRDLEQLEQLKYRKLK